MIPNELFIISRFKFGFGLVIKSLEIVNHKTDLGILVIKNNPEFGVVGIYFDN
jgi:hypothetical protein